MKIKYLIYIIGLALMPGCDVVDGPYSVTIPVSVGNDTAVMRKVLLEDYTGHTCQGCPNAHKEAGMLKGVFKDSLILITIHAGSFAATNQPPFTYDFKTPEGTALYQEFIPASQPFPTGTVNRKYFNSNRIVDFPNWGSSVRSLLSAPPQAKIRINAAWNPGTKIISGTFKTTFFGNVSGDIALSVLFTEDSIVNWQKFPLPMSNDSNYVHRHVLRGSLGGTWGNIIISNALQGDEILTDLYSMPIANDIDAKHVSIVAILYNNSSKEIIQAEEVNLLP